MFGPKYDVKRYPMKWTVCTCEEYVQYSYTNLLYNGELIRKAEIWVRKEHDPRFFPEGGLLTLKNMFVAEFVELDGKVIKNFRRVRA